MPTLLRCGKWRLQCSFRRQDKSFLQGCHHNAEVEHLLLVLGLECQTFLQHKTETVFDHESCATNKVATFNNSYFILHKIIFFMENAASFLKFVNLLIYFLVIINTTQRWMCHDDLTNLIMSTSFVIVLLPTANRMFVLKDKHYKRRKQKSVTASVVTDKVQIYQSVAVTFDSKGEKSTK